MCEAHRAEVVPSGRWGLADQFMSFATTPPGGQRVSSVPDDAGGGNWVLEGREEGASKM